MDLTISSEPNVDAACRLYDLSPQELSERFADVDLIGQWFAYDAQHVPVGVAIATSRADDRVFVTHRLTSDQAYLPLLDNAVAATDRPVNVTIDSKLTERTAGVQAIGFQPELVSTTYEVPFAVALNRLRVPRGAGRFDVARATDVDPNDLFRLDTELRRDVPGSAGWGGNRAWFDDEMGSPEFDPTGYSVAVDSASGELLGLCRMWRNVDGPALGMLGVRRQHRTGFMAQALLRDTLTRSSEWGWPTFTVNTARLGLQRHQRQSGAQETGGFIRFIRP